MTRTDKRMVRIVVDFILLDIQIMSSFQSTRKKDDILRKMQRLRTSTVRTNVSSEYSDRITVVSRLFLVVSTKARNLVNVNLR